MLRSERPDATGYDRVCSVAARRELRDSDVGSFRTGVIKWVFPKIGGTPKSSILNHFNRVFNMVFMGFPL